MHVGLIGMHLRDIYFMGMHLMGVYFMGVYLMARTSWACTSWACIQRRAKPGASTDDSLGAVFGAKSSAKSVTDAWGAMSSKGGPPPRITCYRGLGALRSMHVTGML
jgi:hypothetical protein